MLGLAVVTVVLAVACGGRQPAPPPSAASTSEDGAGGSRPLPIPGEMKPAIEQAARIGRMLFEYDRAAARASDAVLAHVNGNPPAGVQGWVTVEDGDGHEVFWVGADGGDVLVHFVVRVAADDASPVVQEIVPARLAEPAVAAMFRARALASAEAAARFEAAGVELCPAPYNTVVLPASVRGQDGILVYLLAATTEPDVHILAGHHRLHVSADGTQILDVEPMSKTCVMGRPEGGSDVRTMGAMVTHPMTPVPLESHVFASLSHGLPIFVVTAADRVWIVDGTTIQLVELGR